jgi:hypothetical protein
MPREIKSWLSDHLASGRARNSRANYWAAGIPL